MEKYLTGQHLQEDARAPETMVAENHEEHARALETLAAEHHEKHASAPDIAATRAHITTKILEILTEAYRRLDEKRRESNKKPTQHSDEAMLTQAKVLENCLFSGTPTWEAYQNEDTLRSRLQDVQHCRRRLRRPTEWQKNGADLKLRRQMIQLILTLIRKKLPLDVVKNKTYMKERLPKMAQQVEAVLYRQAHTREEYADTESLVLRLTVLAVDYRGSTEEHYHHNVSSL